MKVFLSLGMVRGTLAGLAGTIGGAGLTALVRWAAGMAAWNPGAVFTVGILTGVAAYLAGAGVFTHWARWATGGRGDGEETNRRGWHPVFQRRYQPQGHRYSVPGDGADFPALCRGASDPGAAGDDPALRFSDEPRHLRIDYQRSRHRHAVHRRSSGLRRRHELCRSAADRRPGHGFPAPQCAQLLAGPGGRPAHRLQSGGRRVRHRLDGLRPAQLLVLEARYEPHPAGRVCGRPVVHSDGGQLVDHDIQDAGSRA